jgi:hypothetical protein
MRSHPKSCFSLRQSGCYHLFVASFLPAGQKTGNKETKHTLMPQAIDRIEVATA